MELAFSETGDSETGDGPPVVILHGLFGWKRNWAGIAKTLGATREILALDLRNHGDSPHDEEMTYEAMADDVALFIEKGELGPVPIVGHSMGGKAAMVLALSRPELVERLLVLDIAPIVYGHGFEDFIEVMEGIDFETITRRPEVEAILADAVQDPGVRAFIMQNLKSGDDGRYAWRVNLDAIDRHMEDIVGFPDIESEQAFEGPTLFLGGSESDYLQPYHQAEIERLFPMADIDFIDGAGHWVHADRPDETAQRIIDFLG